MKKLLIALLFILSISISCKPQDYIDWIKTEQNNFEFTITPPIVEIILPLKTGYLYDFVVDWGDGTTGIVTAYNDIDAKHTYSTTGDKKISISGICQSFTVNGGSFKTYIKSIDNWGNCDFREINFYGCSDLSKLPNSSITGANNIPSFQSTFYGCSGLTSIPTDLFRYNTLVSASGFLKTFYGCSGLTSIPTDLFKYNTLCTSFRETFYGCSKLKLNRNIFYADTEQSTRFSGQNVDFTSCFYRTSFTGIQGESPDLWNCSFGSVISTGCLGGAGNNLISLSNYGSIPSYWK